MMGEKQRYDILRNVGVVPPVSKNVTLGPLNIILVGIWAARAALCTRKGQGSYSIG